MAGVAVQQHRLEEARFRGPGQGGVAGQDLAAVQRGEPGQDIVKRLGRDSSGLGAAQGAVENVSSRPQVHSCNRPEAPKAGPSFTVVNGRIERPPFISAGHRRFLVLGRTRFPRAEAGRGLRRESESFTNQSTNVD